MRLRSPWSYLFSLLLKKATGQELEDSTVNTGWSGSSWNRGEIAMIVFVSDIAECFLSNGNCVLC